MSREQTFRIKEGVLRHCLNDLVQRTEVCCQAYVNPPPNAWRNMLKFNSDAGDLGGHRRAAGRDVAGGGDDQPPVSAPILGDQVAVAQPVPLKLDAAARRVLGERRMPYRYPEDHPIVG